MHTHTMGKYSSACVSETSIELQGDFESSVGQYLYLDAHQSFVIFIQLSKELLSFLLLLNGGNNPEELNICVQGERFKVSDNSFLTSLWSVSRFKAVNMVLTWIDPGHGSR